VAGENLKKGFKGLVNITTNNMISNALFKSKPKNKNKGSNEKKKEELTKSE
jgi:hypothetical protein